MKIDRLNHIRKELAEPPNEIANKLTVQLISLLFEQAYYMFRVTPSVEEGIFIEMDIPKGKVFIEIYNTEDIAMCFRDSITKKVIPYPINYIKEIIHILEILY